jgi:hypothetical protein
MMYRIVSRRKNLDDEYMLHDAGDGTPNVLMAEAYQRGWNDAMATKLEIKGPVGF